MAARAEPGLDGAALDLVRAMSAHLLAIDLGLKTGLADREGPRYEI